MASAFRRDDWGVFHQCRHGRGINGGGHDQEHQVLAQRRPTFEGQREAQIRIEGSLVKLVEDQGPDPLKAGIRLDHAGQDALGDHLDPGHLRYARLATNAIADRPADILGKRGRHGSRRGAGCQPPRFKHDDATSDQARRQKGERHPRCLARARRCSQHGLTLPCQRVRQFLQHVVDWKAIDHDAGVAKRILN